MTAYRGIDKADIISSIQNGMALLDKYSTGPECKKMLDHLRTAGDDGQMPLARIAAAQDEKSLATALRASGAAGVFSQLADLLRYHGAANTDGTAEKTVQDLQVWGATGMAIAAVYTPLNEEVDSWLAGAYAGHIEFNAENLKKTDDFLTQLSAERRSDPSAAQMAKDATRMMIEAASLGKTTEIRDSFKLMDLHERHLMMLALQVHSGLHDKPKQQVGALQRFGIFLGKRGDKINWQDPAVETLHDEATKVLSPFYETDEITMSGMGMISDDFEHLGVMFVGTRRAAEALAKAMPDQKIVDNKGKQILPPGTPPVPKKGGFKL
jgi:hypothetical protein